MTISKTQRYAYIVKDRGCHNKTRPVSAYAHIILVFILILARINVNVIRRIIERR